MKHTISRQTNALIGAAISWTSLGFYRGIQDYNYDCAKCANTHQKLYSDQFGRGMLGSFLYINPFFGLVLLQKEIYRLEVNVRSLENEKHTDYYRKLI